MRISPTDGSSLYVCEEKLSQMLPPIALVASGLHALVCSSVTGMRSSVERKLPSRKLSARTILRIFCLKSGVFVQFQYLSKQARQPEAEHPLGSTPTAGLGR